MGVGTAEKMGVKEMEVQQWYVKRRSRRVYGRERG